MIYPEILDRREYAIDYGNTPSIDRVNATAVTIDDTLCACTKVDWVERINQVITIRHKRGHERSLPYTQRNIVEQHGLATYESNEKYDAFVGGKWVQTTKQNNHARNLRKLVMYEEMFELPVMVGVKDIRRELLQRAYNLHRVYIATYNKINRKYKSEHDKYMAKRRAKGEWTWGYGGRYLGHDINEFRIICPDLMLDMVFKCISQKDIPYAELGNFLSLFTKGDVQSMAYIISDVREAITSVDDSVWESCNRHYMYKEHVRSGDDLNSLFYTNDATKFMEILMAINKGNTSIFGVGATVLGHDELLRRIDNLYKILNVQRSIMHSVYPAQMFSKNLKPKRKGIKKLALFYQFLIEGKLTQLSDDYNIHLAKHEAKVQEHLTDSEVKTKQNHKAKYKVHNLEGSILSMVDSAVENSTRTRGGTAPARADNLGNTKTRWARTQFVRGTLNKDLTNKLKARRFRPSDVGTVPKYMNRWVTDKYVWANKRSLRGGTIAIDCSGSMHLDNDDIDVILTNLPAATIVGYSGNRATSKGTEGLIEIFAEKQRRISDIWEDTMIFTGDWGNNLVDVPAIMWLARQPQPRILVSDMEIVGILQKLRDGEWYDAGSDTSENITDLCYDLCRKHKITILKDMDAVREYAKSVAKTI